MEVAVVRLKDEDFEKDIKITDEDISKYYEGHKEQLKSEEKRKVEFVAFTLSEPERKLTGKDRKEPLQKAADRANDFTQALLEKDAKFEDIATKFQTPITPTGDFTAVKPDPQLASTPQLTQYSFQLTQQAPFSDPIQGMDGFYILHLLSITESHPLSLDEAKPKIVETMKADRLRELVSNKGTESSRQIREALKGGLPADKAVAATGLKLERVPPFAIIEPPAPSASPKPTPDASKPKEVTPDLSSIKNAVAALSPGEASDFVPVQKAG